MPASASDALISDFYAAAAGRIGWVQPLDKLTAQLGLWAAQIIGVDKRTGSVVFSAENTLSSPQVALDYLRHYHPSNPRVAPALATPEGQWMHCHEHLDENFVTTNAFYQDFLIPHGGRYISTTKLVDDDHVVFMVGLMRGNGAVPLSDADADTLQLVQHHLSKAIQIFVHLRNSFAEQSFAHELLGQFKHPMLLVDETHRVLHRNHAAVQLLSQRRTVLEKNGYFLCSNAAANDALAGALRDVLLASASTSGKAATSRQRKAVNLAGGSANGLLAFVSAVWPSHSMNAFGDLPRALIILHDPQLPQSQFDPLILAECYDLTPAEARVAVQIASGYSAKEIAQRGALALPTVRTHLSRIMEKTGVARQADLVRILLALPTRHNTTAVQQVGRA